MSHHHHKSKKLFVNCAVITVSDTRKKETDKSGKQIIQLLENEGHQVLAYEIVPDEGVIIRQTVETTMNQQTMEAIIINGGTGIANRDVTIESIQPLFEKELPGFGELFRYLSYQFDIGSASILSRAACGVAKGKVIFALPGSTGAVTLAMEKIILPELTHIVSELHKD